MKTSRLMLAVIIFLAVVLIGTLSVVNHDHDHDCIGSECPVCLIVGAGHHFFKTLIVVVYLAFIVCLSYVVYIYSLTPTMYVLSPVTLKVRFNS